MMTSTYQNQINRIEREIADLYKKIADETKKESDKQRSIDSVQRSITKSTPLTTIQSKQRQIQAYNTEILNCKKKIAEHQKKIADKSIELGRAKQNLLNEEDRQRKKNQSEEASFRRKLQEDIKKQTELLNTLIGQNYSSQDLEDDSQPIKEYDFFISHASEDKEDFVKDFAETLVMAGFSVWYDEFELKIGDSLRKKIDHGLSNSKYGIVVISPNFIKKNWPEYELNGMVAKEMNGHKVILPIWHKVTKDEVLRYSPTLADKLALNTAMHSMSDIISQLKNL